MEAARNFEGGMGRKRRNTEEFLNPWAGEAGWKTDPRTFNVISGAQQARRDRKHTGGPRNLKKTLPRKSVVPFNWLQMVTLFLGVISLGLIAYIVLDMFAV